MIDTVEQASCKICGRPIVRKVWVPHKREFCSGRCKQVDYRNRKREENKRVTIAVTMDEQAMQARIAELEQRVKELSARLALEDAYRYDTQERPFKSWLKKNPHARDTAEVFKRILADTRLPHHGSRSLYEARLKLYGYTASEISLFQAVWTDMLFMQG
jgi:endogenous inhibitor of DNA gyrase (YacG/DUF329 family)